MSNVNPAINERLGHPLMRFLDQTRWYLLTRLSGIVDDALYVTVVLLILFCTQRFQVLINDSTALSIADRFREAGVGVGHWAIVTLIDIGSLTMAMRLAPRNGARRWLALLIGVGVTMVLGNRYFVLVAGYHPSFDHVAQSTIMVLLIATACFFHNTVRAQQGELFRAQMDKTGREAEFHRAQLELLRSQIEPHFLFNTLATVRTLADEDPPVAAGMLDDLRRYFAASLPKLRQNESTLAEEMELIDAYLRIQKVRMGARLSYRFTIPDSLRTHTVPSVMLLTLVENAIKHGIGPAMTGGDIHISAEKQESLLILKVTDTGAGMRAQHGHGSGLANIRARLKLQYRHRASLSLLPGEACGVVASLTLPLWSAA